MPELPDVQVFKEYVDSTCIGRRVASSHVDAEQELTDVSARSLAQTLHGRRLASTHRHGKHLFIELVGGPERWLRLHFGMTGSVVAWDAEEPDQLDHVRMRIDFEDGRHLAYRCQRRFGQVGLVEGPESFVEAHDLGPDPWPRDFDTDRLRERLAGRRGAIKSTLMNQSVLAGLGNIYTDEILFQAEVHPERAVPALSERSVGRLHRVMRRVLHTAVTARGNPARMPNAWLLPDRRDGRTCPRCDGTIQKTRVSGRSTYFCPRHQRLG